ncbi:MAG: cytochrome c [Desulfobacula sp.]|jgi:hypothetical protein|nr:cytochrome c [Desulfobacula sp.]
MKQVLFLAVFATLAITGVYTIITLYDSNMKIGRLYQTPVIRPHEEPLLVMDKQAIPFHKSEALIKETLQTAYPETMTLPIEMILAKGEKDYNTFCSHCHGPNLDGLGTVGQSFNPLPTNLTSEKAVKLSDIELFTVISYGSKNTPALASSMTVESRNAVIQFLRFKQKKTQ